MSIRATRFTGSEQPDDRNVDDAVTPTQRMMLAVLNDAIATYERGLCAETRADVEALEEVERWLASNESSWPFSYAKVCDCLGLEPAFVRDGLRMRKLETLEQIGRQAVRRRQPALRATA